MEMIVDKKEIGTVFLFEFKMDHKAAETTCNINNTFGPGTASECTGQQWLEKFCKGDETLGGEEHSGWSLEVDSDQLRAIIKADPLTTTWEVARELNVDHSVVVWDLKLIGKVKKLNKWEPHELTTNLKKSPFPESSSHILCNNNKPFHAMKSRFYMTAVDDQLSGPKEAPNHISKPNLYQNKGHGLVVCYLSDPLQLSESQKNHYIWEVCSANRCTDKCNNGSWYWSTESAQFFSKTTPDRTMHNQRFESWMNWAMKFYLICHSHLTSHQLTTTSSSVSTTFCRENASTASRR